MKQQIKPASFRLPEELLNELKKVADKSEVTQTIIVREAITEKLKKLQGKKLSVGLEVQVV